VHYTCHVPKDQYEPHRPFWSKHVRLYTKAALREHVVNAIAEFTKT
jgi:hypothetical protein